MMMKGVKWMLVAAWKLEMCAVRRMGAGEYEEALECYRKMMEKVKPAVYHWEKIARCYEWVGESEKAEGAAHRALEADAESFDALRLLARLSIAQGHYAQAREYVHKALAAPRRSAPRPAALRLRLLAVVDKILKGRWAADDDVAFTAEPQGDDAQWTGWAREFLSGYERAFGVGPQASPR